MLHIAMLVASAAGGIQDSVRSAGLPVIRAAPASGSNTRLRWTFDPLGELFVVYNHNITRLTDGWTFTGNELLLKAQYAFRL
jgi:hypothetical protein